MLEGVAAELGVAVSLGDVEVGRLLAHTAHDGVIDDVRRSTLLHRRLPPEVRAWYEQWGIRDARQPVRTPADESLGALARWCVPVRFHERHLGYLWVLDAGTVEESDLGPAIDAAKQIGVLLYRRRIVTQVNEDLLRLILIPNSENASIATEARELGTYMHNGPVAVIVAGAPSEGEMNPATLSDLTLAVRRAAEHVPSQRALAGVIAELAVVLAPLRNRGDLSSAKRLADKLLHLVVHISHDIEIVAAIGGSARLEQASRSYVEARRALRMVRAMPDLGPVAVWDELGVLRTLALLPMDELENGALDPRVRSLLGDEDLAVTAETFLDLAGNVQETALRLYLHRTTLYQRLDRIAALYELDLRRNGDHRLITHLGLKLARIVNPKADTAVAVREDPFEK